MRFGGVSCLAFWFAVSAAAQQAPIVADRPGLADGSSVVGRGTGQIETAIQVEDADGSLLTLPTLFRYGLTEAFELRVESGVLGISSDDQDWMPVTVGFKWRAREGEVPLSLIASLLSPSGGRTLGTRNFETGLRIVSDLDVGGGFSLTPNAGVGFVEGEGPFALVAATVAREIGDAEPFVDFAIQYDEDATSMIVDGGIAWIVSSEMQLDLSAGASVSGDANDYWFVAAGVSRRF